MLDQIEVLQAAAEAMASREARAAVRQADGEAWNPRLLLADDDAGFRRMLRDWLTDLGVRDFVEAADGVEAVDLAETTCPDLILMDLRMPNMDGIEAARRVRATLPSAQVVMLSGYGDGWLQHAAEEAGVYSYLVKGCPPKSFGTPSGSRGRTNSRTESTQPQAERATGSTVGWLPKDQRNRFSDTPTAVTRTIRWMSDRSSGLRSREATKPPIGW